MTYRIRVSGAPAAEIIVVRRRLSLLKDLRITTVNWTASSQPSREKECSKSLEAHPCD